MDIIGLILSLTDILSMTELSSESNKYRSEKPFDEVGGSTWFGRCETLRAGGACGGTRWSGSVGTAGIVGNTEV